MILWVRHIDDLPPSFTLKPYANFTLLIHAKNRTKEKRRSNQMHNTLLAFTTLDFTTRTIPPELLK